MEATGLDKKSLATIRVKGITSLMQPVDTVGVQRALSGETGFDIFPDYRGVYPCCLHLPNSIFPALTG